MPGSLPENLKNAAELIKAGQIKEARAILAIYVRQHPDSDDAWFLLSYVAPQKDLQVDCLMRTLSLNPEHGEARARLNKLTPSSPPSSTPSPTPPPPPTAAPTVRSLPFEGIAKAYERMSQNQPPQVEQSSTTAQTDETSPASQHPAQGIDDEKIGGTSTPPFEAPVSSLFDFIGPETSTPAFLQKEPFISAPESPQLDRDKFQTQENSPKGKTKKKFRPRLLLIVPEAIGIIALLAGLLYFNSIRPGLAILPSKSTATHDYSQPPTPIHTAMITYTMTVTITPILSETPTPTITPTMTTRPSRTPTITQTIVPVDASVGLQMDILQKQVSALRGLTNPGPFDRTLITQPDVQNQLAQYLLTNDTQATLKKDSRAYSVLGLIDPGYDLSNFILNQQINLYNNNLYLPWRNEIIVMGLNFSSLERFGYAEAYDNFLVNQALINDKTGIGPGCPYDHQRCQAIDALYRGDAVLLMNQWVNKYANAADNQAITSFNSAQVAFPESSPPDFITRNIKFPTTIGYAFVKALFAKGGWGVVNQAYKNPPLSTEQILHPEDYLARKAPVAISIPDISGELGSDWQLMDGNSLGEWNTYLLLGYGTNLKARVDDNTASSAAVGWSGDAYQVYLNGPKDKTALVVKWAWTTTDNAGEFHQAMLSHLQALYQNATENDQDHGSCWLAPDQIACLYTTGKQSIWIVAPDQVTFTTLLKQFPDFP